MVIYIYYYLNCGYGVSCFSTFPTFNFEFQFNLLFIQEKLNTPTDSNLSCSAPGVVVTDASLESDIGPMMTEVNLTDGVGDDDHMPEVGEDKTDAIANDELETPPVDPASEVSTIYNSFRPKFIFFILISIYENFLMKSTLHVC